MTDNDTPTTDDHLLAVYLRDHFAAAAAGLALAERCQRANDDNPLGAVMAEIVAEIAADRDSLRSFMRALDVSEDPLKAALGHAAELVGSAQEQRDVHPLLAVEPCPGARRALVRHRRQTQPLALPAPRRGVRARRSTSSPSTR